jgi:hypothetical protein
VAPNGIVGVDVDNDLYRLNDKVTLIGCKQYGKIMTLFGEIDKCIAVLDFPCPVPYVFSGGVIYANFAGANTDLYDLNKPMPPYTWYTEAFYGKNGKPLLDSIPPINPAIKMCIHNYAWTGYPSAFFAQHIPTLVVGNEQAELFNRDPLNLNYMNYAALVKDLETAMNFAYTAAETKNVIVFDGAMGALNVSEPLAKLLLEKAPGVSRRVDKELLPKWLRQRGVDVSVLKK